MIATQVLAKVDGQRLQKTVEALVSGSYTITVTEQSDTELRGFVTNGDGKEYGVALSEGQSFCSCKDAMYRKGICKHAVVLALHVIRTPTMEGTSTEGKEEPAEQPVNLKLSKVRRHFAFSA
jgi:hypothetical protein